MGVTLIYLRDQGMLSRLLINNELGLKGEICCSARCLDAWKKIMPQPKSRKIAVLGYRSVGE